MTVQTYATGQEIRLKAKLNPGDTSLTADVDVGVDKGRLYFVSNLQEEWLEFTGVSASGSNFTYSGLTRGLNQTADPVTTGTGKTWLAGSIGTLVAMHDQLIDKTVPTQSHQEALTFATTTARDTALGGDGVCTINYVDVKCTDTGLFYNYNTSSGQWEVQGTGTATPNASTTVAGSVEIATQTEVDNGTDTGGSGAKTVVMPSQMKAKTDTLQTNITNATSKGAFSLLLGAYGNGSDGDIVINSGTTTLTRDMNYNNLTVTNPGILETAGYRIYIKGTFSGNGDIKVTGGGGTGGTGAVGRNGGGTGANGGGTGLGTGSTNVGVNGGNGSTSGTNTPGGTGASATTYLTGNGANGGNGHNGTSYGTGGPGGTSTRGLLYNSYFNLTQLLHPASNVALPVTTTYKIRGGAGGGGGGALDGSTGGGGGGGGASGGIIWISAYIFNFTGTATAVGYDGGAGGAGNSPGGGGGGGTGGVCYYISSTFTAIGTQVLTGGAGGASGGGTAVAGTNGTIGSLIQITL